MNWKILIPFAVITLQAFAQGAANLQTPSDHELDMMWGTEAARAFGGNCPSYAAQQIFIEAATRTATAMREGRPVHLYRMDARGGTTDEMLGLPIQKGRDSEFFGRPVMDGNFLMEDAKVAVLSWYAQRGIYAVNSTKRKRP